MLDRCSECSFFLNMVSLFNDVFFSYTKLYNKSILLKMDSFFFFSSSLETPVPSELKDYADSRLLCLFSRQWCRGPSLLKAQVYTCHCVGGHRVRNMLSALIIVVSPRRRSVQYQQNVFVRC